MNVQGRIVLCVLAGVAAGLLTWFVSDLSGFMHIPDLSRDMTAADARQQQILGMVFGGLVGALLGVADALASGTTAAVPRAAGIGLVVGVISGAIGLVLGQQIYAALYRFGASNPLAFLGNVLARAAGWGLIGALAGTADGWRKWSFRVGRNGFIGGLIGGLIGGTAFEIVPYLVPGMPRPGVLSRLAGFTITGAAIGLFVALVQQLLKEAWIRVLVGRNEGKEYLVEKAETKIGRAELSDVPLFGDPNVARVHAVLAAVANGRFVLRDAGSSGGTFVNGTRIAEETTVRDGDQIQIGGRTLIFHERLTRRRTEGPARDVAAPRTSVAVPSSLPPLGSSLPPLAPSPPSAPPGAPSGAAAYPANGAAAVAQQEPAAATGPRLVVISGPHSGMSFSPGPAAVIGRDPESDIALPGDSKTSRTHARLIRDGSGWIIEDAGSTNGTFVNGQRVTRQALVAGDTIQVGASALRLE